MCYFFLMTGIELALGQSWDCVIMVIDSFKLYLWRASNLYNI